MGWGGLAHVVQAPGGQELMQALEHVNVFVRQRTRWRRHGAYAAGHPHLVVRCYCPLREERKVRGRYCT